MTFTPNFQAQCIQQLRICKKTLVYSCFCDIQLISRVRYRSWVNFRHQLSNCHLNFFDHWLGSIGTVIIGVLCVSCHSRLKNANEPHSPYLIARHIAYTNWSKPNTSCADGGKCRACKYRKKWFVCKQNWCWRAIEYAVPFNIGPTEQKNIENPFQALLSLCCRSCLAI